jgi:hypothetical protein
MSNAKKCPVVECMLPECMDQCAAVSYFGNLSSCTVLLQFQLNSAGLWHSLGEYGPGVHTELGGGALFLPRTSNLRAVNKKTGQVITDFGNLGTGLRTLYVDNSMCSDSGTKTTGQETKSTETVNAEPSKHESGILLLLLIVCSLLGVLSILGILWLKIKISRPS